MLKSCNCMSVAGVTHKQCAPEDDTALALLVIYVCQVSGSLSTRLCYLRIRFLAHR